MKPNFIVIGAARSGTTSLHKYIEAHPDIFMSKIKEINYFSNPETFTRGEKWYLRHFQGATQKMVGEASTSYTVAPHRPHVPERIIALLGPIKLVYILRDPVDRLVSHYLHYVQRGQINDSIHEVVKRETHPMMKQGCYAYQLTQYLEYFPRENIHLLTINQLKQRPRETIAELYRFLGVDDGFCQFDFDRPHNVNKRITQKSQFGKKVLAMYRSHIEQRHVPYVLKKIMLKLAEFGSSEVSMPELSDAEIDSLIRFYANDIAQLSREFGVDIDGWRDYAC